MIDLLNNTQLLSKVKKPIDSNKSSVKAESEEKIDIQIKNLNGWFGNNHVLKGISLVMPSKKVTAIIGPSGCGKSTMIRCVNRMHEVTPDARTSGEIIIDGEDVSLKDPVLLRREVGMVFQKAQPFPSMSIFKNVSAGLKLNGLRNEIELSDAVEKSLKDAALWDEVKDKLNSPGTSLSGGQQQRLCIARTLAIQPKILLLDEPCSALDPISTAKIEELILELKKNYTIVIVTHNMQQAARISDETAFLLLGELIEYGEASQIFTNPKDQRTEDYVTGRFG